MSEVTIVALPKATDSVWRYSSEKQPHLTMLFLGEVNDGPKLAQIVNFVDHVSSLVPRFGLRVDSRGPLGPKDADVLFFKGERNIRKISDVRDNLLKNLVIKTAYDSTEQYPVWTPHLTMGFPNTPAKEDNREYPGFHWVEFDRLAVWVDDYDGPEFPLQAGTDYDMDLAHSEAMGDFLDFYDRNLAHYGVKGMKWGIRKTRDGGGIVTVKGRPTYTTAEKREAAKTVKGGGTHDKDGYGVERVAKLRTPSRRMVNAVLGTKVSNLTLAATVASGAAAVATLGPGAMVPAILGSQITGTFGQAHVAYKTYFNNLRHNPKIRIKQKVDADVMASLKAGEDVRLLLMDRHGSALVSSLNKGKDQTAVLLDQEGRQVGKSNAPTKKVQKDAPEIKKGKSS